MGEITKTEEDELLKFRQRLSDLELNSNNNALLTDMQLIRWLRARDMDLVKAEQMFRNHLSWRRDFNIDSILESVPITEEFKAAFPVEIFGQDKQGNVLVHIPFGKIDMKKGLNMMGKENSKRISYFLIENLMKECLIKSKDKTILTQFSGIIDFENFSYLAMANTEVIDFLLSSIKTFEQHYPELLCQFYMVNAPSAFSLLWALAKPLVHRKTLEKVVLVGPDPVKILEVLSKYIEKDQIPEKFGGSAKLQYPDPVIMNSS